LLWLSVDQSRGDDERWTEETDKYSETGDPQCSEPRNGGLRTTTTTTTTTWPTNKAHNNYYYRQTFRPVS